MIAINQPAEEKCDRKMDDVASDRDPREADDKGT